MFAHMAEERLRLRRIRYKEGEIVSRKLLGVAPLLSPREFTRSQFHILELRLGREKCEANQTHQKNRTNDGVGNKSPVVSYWKNTCRDEQRRINCHEREIVPA